MNKKGMPPNKMTGIAMRGGIDIDLEEMKTLPECNYWRWGALWAKTEIYNVFDGCGVDDRVNRILGKFFNENNTWMTICLKTERMLRLINLIMR